MPGPWEKYQTPASGPWSKYQQKSPSPADLEKKAMDPNSSYTPTTESTGHTGTETKVGKSIETGGKALVGALPMIGGTVGGALGAIGAGPVGAVGGAAAGGAVGKNIENRFEGQDPHAGTGTAAITQGATELVGGVAIPKMLEKIGAKAVPKVYKALTSYIGLKPSDLPKWGRTVEDADKITSTVLQEAGVKKTLEAQEKAIEAAREARDIETAGIVAHPASRQVNVAAKIANTVTQLDRRISLGEFPEFNSNMLQANLNELNSIASSHGATPQGNMVPSEMHAMRKSIQKQISDWSSETKNARQWLLQKIYHDLNDGIAQGLPSDAAAAFKANNRIQRNLIIARDAATEKLNKQRLEEVPGLATKAYRTVGGAALGAAGGAGYATVTGRPQDIARDAAIWGTVGAVGGSFSHTLRPSGSLPATDVKVQQAISKAAPFLAKVAKKAAPAGARAVQATIKSIQSRPQNQP